MQKHWIWLIKVTALCIFVSFGQTEADASAFSDPLKSPRVIEWSRLSISDPIAALEGMNEIDLSSFTPAEKASFYYLKTSILNLSYQFNAALETVDYALGDPDLDRDSLFYKRLLLEKGYTILNLGQFDEAKNLFEKLKSWELLADYPDFNVKLYVNLSAVYLLRLEQQQSYDLLLKALEIAPNGNDKLSPYVTAQQDVTLSLAEFGIFNQEWTKSIEMTEALLDYYRNQENVVYLYQTLMINARAQMGLGKIESSERLFLEAITLTQSKKLTQLSGYAASRLAYLYTREQQYEEALPYLDHAIDAALEVNDEISLIDYGFLKVRTLIKMQKPKEAESILENIDEIITKYDIPFYTMGYHFIKSEYYEAIGDYKSALSHTLQAESIEDTIKKESEEKRINELEAQFKVSQKEKEALQAQGELERAEIERQYLFLAILIISLALIVVLIMLYKQYILEKKVSFLVTTDELTGLANRRSIFAILDNQVKLMRNQEQPMTIALVNIDHFSDINDQYGHDTGDQILTFFVDTCIKHLRNTDYVGRIGGEKFIIILPATGFSEAKQVFTKFMSIIRASRYSINQVTLSITVSVGYQSYQPQYLSKFERKNELSEIDDRLHQAKTQGRDRAIGNDKRV